MPTQITLLPTPPSRSDPTNFADRGDAFLGALPTFGIQANALATEVNTASADAVAASVAAVGAANYKGDYSAATTYTQGQSVSYLGERYVAKTTTLNNLPTNTTFWQLITNLPSQTGNSGKFLTTNGTNASWENITNYNELLARATDVTLTSATAGQYYVIEPTTPIKINLPDATTLTALRHFVIRNTSGAYPLMVYNAAGTYLFTIRPEAGVVVWAEQVATAAGLWALDRDPDVFFSSGLDGVYWNLTAQAETKCGLDAISTTQAIRLFSLQEPSQLILNGYNTLYAVIITYSAGLVSYGKPSLLATDVLGTAINTNFSNRFSICMLSSTLGVVTYQSPSGLVVFSITINSGGIVRSPGSIAPSVGTNSYRTDLCRLSSTTATLAATDNNTTLYYWVITPTATGVSFGTTNSLTNVQSLLYNFKIRNLSSTSGVIVYYNSAASQVQAIPYTVSGTAITPGTNTNIQTSVPVGSSFQNYFLDVTVLSSTTFVVVYNTSGFLIVGKAITSNGATLTQGTEVTVEPGLVAFDPCISALSATSAVCSYTNNSGTTVARVLSISGTTITVNGSTVLQTGIAPSFSNIVALQAPQTGVPSASTLIYSGYSQNLIYSLGLSVSGTSITPFTGKFVTNYAVQSFVDVINGANATTSFNNQYGLVVSKEVGSDTANPSIASGSLFISLIDYSTVTPTLVQKIRIATNYADTTSLQIKAISTTQAIIVYRTASDLQGLVITLSGSTISAGASVVLNATQVALVTLDVLNTTTAIIGYTASASAGYSFAVLTVTGSTLTQGTVTVVIPTNLNVSSSKVSMLTATTGLWCFYSNSVALSSANSSTFLGYITISAGVVSLNSLQLLLSEGFTTKPYSTLVPLSSSKCLLFSGNVANETGTGYGINSEMEVMVVDLTAGVITVGERVGGVIASAGRFTAAAINSSEVLVIASSFYNETGTDYRIMYQRIWVSGNNCTVGEQKLFDSGFYSRNPELSLCPIGVPSVPQAGSGRLLLNYREIGKSSSNMYKIRQIFGRGPVN